MKTFPTILLALIFALIGGAYYLFHHQKPPPSAPIATAKPVKHNESLPSGIVNYSCFDKKSLTADYRTGTTASSTDGSVHLKLSDGRELTLPQTRSNNGARYANADQSFVYWGKGERALVLEKNENTTYASCIRVMEPPAGISLPQMFSHSTGDFSLRLPAGYTSDEDYKYQAFGPGNDIAGVKFTIPGYFSKGTNLSEDSYISVENIPYMKDCTANVFLDQKVTSQTLSENGTVYSTASSTGAAAGNRYEETVYAIVGTNPCVAVRYFIHYGAIENYSTGSVREFDALALHKQLDAIRRTLLVVQ